MNVEPARRAGYIYSARNLMAPSLDRIVVTGATGFVGRALMTRLAKDERCSITALSRTTDSLPEFAGNPRVRCVRARLDEPASYSRELRGAALVVHVAALVGKASPDEFTRANVEATRALLETATENGVRRFLHVSTIAVKYPEKSHYAYARSKEAAEALVRASRLDWAIARPTMVLGRGSSPGASMVKLARGPWVPIFGAGSVRVQPIDVGDLADCLLDVIGEREFGGRTLEFGGPEVATFRELLARLHLRFAKKPARMLHIPLGLAIGTTAMLEPLFRSLMPLTAGQLYAFAYDSNAASNSIVERRRGSMKTIDAQLDELATFARSSA